ncbi:MAG: apolipoprotein N-acyltransferase, partial [Elusimicrobia bacterium]|nr:apolipoprotein N-acyltransferase [Elusimicrobiota bacterium]
FGAAGTMAGVPWLMESLRRFTAVPQPEAFFWFAALCAWHGLQFGLACGAARWLGERLARARGWDPAACLALAFVPAMAAAEGFYPTAFPGQLANSQVFHLPTVQLVSVLGPGGVAWLALCCNAALFALLFSKAEAPRRWAAALACAGLLLGNEAWGRFAMGRTDRLAALGASLDVGLIQGAQPARRARDSYQDMPLHDMLSARALAAGAADLVVWPESTLEGEVSCGEPGSVPIRDGRPLPEALRREVRTPAPLLLSALGRDAAGAVRNVSLLIGPGREFWGLSEKMVLVPFGEYVPGGRALSWIRRLSPRTGRLSVGRRRTLLELPGKAKFGVLVCYEDLLPGAAAACAELGAGFLVNQTNDAWFDQGMAPEQHLRFSVLRAVENRLYLLRAANTGISAVVDPAGRVLRRVERGERGFAAARITAAAPAPRRRAAAWPYPTAVLALALLALAGRRKS